MLTSRFNPTEVIADGHPPVAKGVVCVDFDGTIFPFGQMDVSNVAPIPGAAEAVRTLKGLGYQVVIFSSRFSRKWHEHEGWDHQQALNEQSDLVRAALNLWSIPYDALTAEKIPAVAYFDDKAWRADIITGGLAGAVSDFLLEEKVSGR